MLPPPVREPVRTGLSLGSQSQMNRLQPSQATQAREESAPESLFMPADERTVWDPPDYDTYGQEEQLGYDASYNQDRVAPRPTLQDNASGTQRSRQISLLSGPGVSGGLEATQRLSQVSPALSSGACTDCSSCMVCLTDHKRSSIRHKKACRTSSKDTHDTACDLHHVVTIFDNTVGISDHPTIAVLAPATGEHLACG